MISTKDTPKYVRIGTLFLSTILLLFITLKMFVRPETSAVPHPLRFSVPKRDPVAMHIHNSATSYDPTTAEGLEAFERLLPSGGHTIQMSQDESDNSVPEVYTVALFHRMKCLEIISKQYASSDLGISPLTNHCMNYLRQSILCRMNLRLESVITENGYAEKGGYDAVCKDWTAVYDEAERNHKDYISFVQNRSNGTRDSE